MSVTRTAISRIDGGFTKTDEGFLDVAVFPTKVGIFNYLRADGSVRRELRSREEVFKADSLKTLVNKPHTNDHPPQNLTSRNVKKHKTGHVYGAHEVHDDNIHTRSRLLVTDQDAIDDIEQKAKTPVSCGYTCDMDETPGIDPEFGEYDAKQLNIRYNHLSSVWKARAGEGARITQDSDEDHVRFDAYEIDENNDEINKKEGLPKMGKIRVDGVEFEVEQALEIAHKNQVKADTQALNDAKVAAEKADKLNKEFEAKLDEAQDKIKELSAVDVEARVDAVLAFREQVKPVLGADYDFKGKSEAQVKKDAIMKARPQAKLDGQDDLYINARFDAVMEDLQANPKQTTSKSVNDAYDAAKSQDSGEWGTRYDLAEAI